MAISRKCWDQSNCWDCLDAHSLCEWRTVYNEYGLGFPACVSHDPRSDNPTRQCPTETLEQGRALCAAQKNCSACVDAVDGSLCGWYEGTGGVWICVVQSDHPSWRVRSRVEQCANTCLKCVRAGRVWSASWLKWPDLVFRCKPLQEECDSHYLSHTELPCSVTEQECVDWEKENVLNAQQAHGSQPEIMESPTDNSVKHGVIPNSEKYGDLTKIILFISRSLQNFTEFICEVSFNLENFHVLTDVGI